MTLYPELYVVFVYRRDRIMDAAFLRFLETLHQLAEAPVGKLLPGLCQSVAEGLDAVRIS